MILGNIEFGDLVWIRIGPHDPFAGTFRVSVLTEQWGAVPPRKFVEWIAHLEPFHVAICLYGIDQAFIYTPEIESQILHHGLRNALLAEIDFHEV